MKFFRTFLALPLILLAYSVSGQYIKVGDPTKIKDTTNYIVNYLKGAIKLAKLSDNQYSFITDNGVIYLMGFLKEEQLRKKEEVSVWTQKQCMDIYKKLKEGEINGKHVSLDGLSFVHTYYNQTFMNYGDGLISTCNIENGVITGFDITVGKGKREEMVSKDIYNKFSVYDLKPNQYMGQHKLDKNTLVLMNTVEDVTIDRKKDSNIEYKRLKESIKSLSPYKRLLVRYQSKYDPSVGKDYFYTL